MAYVNRELSVDFVMDNTAGPDAYNVEVVGTIDTGGVWSKNTPLTVGNIPTGGTAGTTLVYHVPIGILGFNTTVYATAEDQHGNLFEYPAAYPAP
jgi:hypothetical protein